MTITIAFSSINTKILIVSKTRKPRDLWHKKKKNPSNLVLLEFGHVLFSSTILFERECYKEKKSGQRGGVFQVVVKSISQLGHWVIRWMMIRGYLERSPPITVRTTAEKGGLEYLSRVTWPRINGREERGTVKFARISEREGGREETNRMEINTRISLWIS